MSSNTQTQQTLAIPLLRPAEGEEDAALVAAAKNGNQQAFEILVKRYEPKILAVALRYTRVQEDAEDAVQQSFQNAFVHLHTFGGQSSFSTWLTRIAINEALRLLRRSRVRRQVSIDDNPFDGEEAAASRLEIADSDPDPEAIYLQQERAWVLSAAMDKLRPGVRKAIELRDFGELSTEQTARRMGLSVAAVKARLFQGRRKLREILTRGMRAPRACGEKNSRSHGGTICISRFSPFDRAA